MRTPKRALSPQVGHAFRLEGKTATVTHVGEQQVRFCLQDNDGHKEVRYEPLAVYCKLAERSLKLGATFEPAT